MLHLKLESVCSIPAIFLYKEFRYFLIGNEDKFGNFRNSWRRKKKLSVLLSRLVWTTSTDGDAQWFINLLLWKYCFYTALQSMTYVIPGIVHFNFSHAESFILV